VKRIVVLAVAIAAVIISSVAGAASSGPSTKPVRYAPGSEYVFDSSGKKVGTLNGTGLNTQFLSIVANRGQ
jgi:hypothetical protein